MFVSELLISVFVCQNRDCAQLGPPPQGDVVQVRWTDGLVYGAKFVAAHVIQMYLVRVSAFNRIKNIFMTNSRKVEYPENLNMEIIYW